MRLASVQGYVERSEPMPFIVDDIFVHFDDRRSAAALQVLGELSDKTQLIVFTHHPHLLQLAKATVAHDILFAHAMGG
jgi:uncharacterized protein YhaN